MKRKCWAVGIILLFIGAAIIPSSGQDTNKSSSPPTSSGNTFYVGGSGPENYSTIQDAIDSASNEDTIFVYDDSSPYYEHVIVNKKLSLIGENKETTVIDGQYSDDVVHISCDHVTLSGFTLTGGGNLGFPNYDDAGVDIESNYSNITDNFIQSNGVYGVLIGSYDAPMMSYNKISHNIIINNHYGVYLMWSNYNVIRNNTICHNKYKGVYLSGSPCSSNKIIDNNISFNRLSGIGINDGNNNIIQGNIVTSNNNSGIYIVWDSNTNKIINNYVARNQWDGIDLGGKYGQVSGNTIEGNLLEGLVLDSAVYSSIFNNSFIKDALCTSALEKNSIYGNTVNGKPLIYLNEQHERVIENAGQIIVNKCDNITIKNCNISCTDWGILLYNSNDCSILNNQIYGITQLGLYLSDSSSTTVKDNAIYENGPEDDYGCSVFVTGGSSNKFIRNRIVDNVPGGMILESSNNTLQRNTFSNDGDFGLYLDDAYDNWIIFNNFLNNTRVIYNFHSPHGFEFIANHWLNNYWGRPHFLPKILLGLKYFYIQIPFFPISIPIPVVNIDFRPALFPH